MVGLINALQGCLYSTPFIVLLFGTSVYFSIAMKFPQFRLIKDMVRCSTEKNSGKDGLTPFQSLMTTVGGRVGIGNIAGVAAAIACGGPGAVFWMWLLALLAASMAFVESSLAQVYKQKVSDNFVGGTAYYIEHGLHAKPFAILAAVILLLGVSICVPGIQTSSIASTLEEAYGVPYLATGIGVCVIVAVVIFGGVKRIGKVASVLSPIMAIAYLLVSLVVIFSNLTKVPSVFVLIFSSAFGSNSVFGGIAGAAISFGVQRGLFSNEAGLGSGAMISGSAVSTHPAKQGLIQALSVFIDTILVCTATALVVLLTDCYNVYDAAGSAIVEHLPGVAYGPAFVTNAINRVLSGFGSPFMAFSITLFALTCLFAFYTVVESVTKYLFQTNRTAVLVVRLLFLCGTFIGVLNSLDMVWALADVANGLIAWINIIAILLLSPQAFKVLKDYEKQKKEGKDPRFNPRTTLNLTGTVWDTIHSEEKSDAADDGNA